MSKHLADEGTRQVKITDPDTHELLGYVDVYVQDGSAVTAAWLDISRLESTSVALGGTDAPKSSQNGAQGRTEAYP